MQDYSPQPSAKHMKNFSLIALLTTLFLIAGCSSNTIKKTNKLSLGMTKAEVIEALGDPDSSRAAEGVEYLTYRLKPGNSAGENAVCGMAALFTVGLSYAAPECRGGFEQEYFIKFRSGKVISYGKVGDFDSTK